MNGKPLGLAALLGMVLLATAARAHEGEQHDARPVDSTRLAAAHGPLQPSSASRLTLSSETFELVGLLQGRTLTVWVDRFADNTPVPGARLRLDLAGQVIEATAAGHIYRIELPTAPGPGSVPVVATIVTPDTSDLLTGEWLIPQAGVQSLAPQGSQAPDAAAASPRALLEQLPASVLMLGAATAILTGALGWLLGRRRKGATS